MTSQSEQHIPIFVGSTYEDLKDYRSAVMAALHRLETIVRGMEYFGSKPESPKKECLKAVASCRVYIGIFAMRYGSIDEETGKSMTHLEFDEAAGLKLPSLIYLIDEDNQPVLPKFVDTGDKAEHLKKLKGELKKRFTVSFFTTPEDLAKRVAQDLPPLLKSVGVPVARSLPSPIIKVNDLSDDEEEILHDCASDGELHILGTAGFGSWVRSGKKDFFDQNDRAIQARYMDAFESLRLRDYVRHSSGNLYRLTGSGFQRARQIAATKHESAAAQNVTTASLVKYSEGDKKAILASWMGSRPSNLNTEVIHFAQVDRELKLEPGTTKKHIKEIAARWRYIAEHEGEQTILFREAPSEDSESFSGRIY
jgi:hypothetical protein